MMDSNAEEGRGTDDRDEDDDDEYEEGSGLLEFMFGNIDGSGDLDIDYLDEDAKEHLAALADKLGSSLTDIDLSVEKSHKSGYAAEQDYDLKAEDAVDYEDIDEQYEGPEVQALTEEDYLLPKSDYVSTTVSSSSLFDDDDNYDEDAEEEEPQNKLQTTSLSGEVVNDGPPVASQEKCSPENGGGALAIENLEPDVTEIQKEETHIFEEPFEPKSSTPPLPVLCVEDGKVILRFSEIFAIQEPLKKAAKRKQQSFSVPKEYIVEDDEEAFLKKGFPYIRQHGRAFQDEASTLPEESPKSAVIVDEDEIVASDVDDQSKDYCDDDVMRFTKSASSDSSSLDDDYFPLDQQDWEDRIIYDNSPHVSERNEVSGPPILDEENHFSAERFGSNKSPESYSSCEETIYHPQLLRLESRVKTVESGDTIKRFNKLTLRNKDLLDGTWTDRIVWDPQQSVVPKAKLLLDLQDEHMLFEVLDNKDGEHLQLHAGAMITTRSTGGDLLEPHGYGGHQAGGKFNISNDKFYSNMKFSQQQLKSRSKKPEGGHGVKVLHSIPARKQQTKKVKLSKKVQNLSAINSEENESEVEDLDSFAGDLENLLDAEEGDVEEVSNHENLVGVKGLKMRRLPSQAQAQVEIEDEAAEAAELCRMLMGDDEAERKKKKVKPGDMQQLNHNFKNKEKDEILNDGMNIVKVGNTKKNTRKGLVRGACGQVGHMRSNKYCPKYRQNSNIPIEMKDIGKMPNKSIPVDSMVTKPQQKNTVKKLIQKSGTKLALVEVPLEDERSSSKAKVQKVRFIPPSSIIPEKAAPSTSLVSGRPATSDAETVNNRSSVEVNTISIDSNKSKTEDIQVESHKPSSPPAESNIIRNPPRKTIVIRRRKEIIDLDQISQEVTEPHKTKRMTELSRFQNHRDDGSGDFWPDSAQNNDQFWEEDDDEQTPVRSYYEEERVRRREEQENIAELRRFEEAIKQERLEEMQQREKKKKKNTMFEARNDYYEDVRPRRDDRQIPERNRSAAKRKPVLELGGRFSADYTPTVKRRRGGGQVELSNILEKIIDIMKSNQVFFLFLKPVTKKDAPNYLRFIDRPMDLSTIKEKARKLEYKNRGEFRHDVCQITINAHIYNDGRNPGIPPLADQLLEMCDRLLIEFEEQLDNAEDNI